VLDTYRRIETPEGVELGLRIAGPAARSLAWALDVSIRTVCYMVASPALFAIFGDETGTGALLLLMFAGEWLYPIAFEAAWGGRTPGKRTLGLVVLHDDGTPLGWSAAIVRNLVRFADFLPLAYGLGICSMLLSRDFKRLGDLAAGTVVCHADAHRRKGQVPEADPLPPARPLSAAESRAIVDYAIRCERLTKERARELSDLLAPLSGAKGEAGQRRLLSLANWLAGRRAA
jgi:uncharacterized RDD family membrane protein YckC